MNNYYGNRLVKFVSPQCDTVFSLELGGDEMELKDLIATLLNIPISYLKGIKDTQNNYYTFSSAIKNQQLTSSYSKYYTIVLGNSFNNENYNLSQWAMNNYDNIPNQSIEPIKQSVNQVAFAQKSKQEQLLTKLLKGNYIDEKTTGKLNQLLIEDNNHDLKIIFNNYNGYDLKILAGKLLSIMNQEQEKSSIKEQLITYSDILESIDDHFEDKNDLTILKRFLAFDNEHIIKVFQNYEEDCDILKLVDNLNQMVILYKDKFEDIKQVSNLDQPKDTEENKMENLPKLNRDFVRDNYNKLYQMLSVELKAILCYAKHFNNNYPQLFEIDKPFDENDKIDKAANLVKKYYDEFMQSNIYSHLKKDELETYDKIMNDNNNNKGLGKVFELFESNFIIEELRQNIIKNIKEHMNQSKNKGKAAESKPDNKTEDNNNNNNLIIKKKKEKRTFTLKYQNSVNVIPKQTSSIDNNNNNETIVKKQSEESVGSNNRKLQEFTKVVNNLSIEDQFKIKILQLLSQKEAKVVKIYDNFVKNKMSLTKNVILNVIQSSSDNQNSNSSKNKEEQTNKPPSIGQINHNENKDKTNNKTDILSSISSFDSVIVNLEKQKVISSGESAFIKKRFQNNDEMLLSIWEVFKASNGEMPDFIDSLQTFIAKHHAKSINLPEPVGAKTPISITNTKKEMLNLFRSNEKSEMNKIKNKQKQIISLLLKENLIDPSNYDFFNMKIDAEEHIVSSVFEVFSVTRDHRDFVETLNLIKDIMYNKESANNDPLLHQKNILNELLDKTNFSSIEKEILIEGLVQNDQTILSVIELYEAERDFEEAIDTLQIYSKNKLKKKKSKS